MAKITKSPKSSAHEKSLMEKIGEQASHLKEEIIAGKDHLVEVAEDKFAAVKATIKKYRAGRKAKKTIKKVAKKITVKKVLTKKAVKRAVKKSAPKKAAKKSTSTTRGKASKK